jgi:hypothetical protein
MASFDIDPIQVFDQSFPASLQQATVELLREVYAYSHDTSQVIVQGPHNQDLLPHLRRAIVESRLQSLIQDYPGVQVRIEENRSRNTHIVIEGPNIILTESFARAPSKVVRWAAYRSLDSMQNYPLFRNTEPPDELRPEMKFNAVLLHGHRPNHKNELGFAVIRFPTPGFRKYLRDLINLLDRYPVAPFVPQTDAMEEIPDTIEPKILTDRPIRKDS